jgi:hypothetical protein
LIGLSLVIGGLSGSVLQFVVGHTGLGIVLSLSGIVIGGTLLGVWKIGTYSEPDDS